MRLIALFSFLSLAVVSVSCSGGGARCSASTCQGCCDANTGVCQLGNTDSACGRAGAMCSLCPAGQTCNAGLCNVGGVGGGSGTAGSGTAGGSGATAGGDGMAGGSGATAGGMGTAGGSGATAGGTGATAGGTGATAGGTGATAGGTGATAGGTGATAGGTGATAGGTGGTAGGATAGGTGGTAGGTGGTAGGTGGTAGGAASCPGNCANGCCLGTLCVPYANQNNSTCGTGAAMCQACQGGATCNGSGVCQGGCSAATCQNGCCSNGICIPATAQSATNCGLGGNACMMCPAGFVCNGGVCTQVPTATVGSACTSAAGCASLGANAVCKQSTDFGGGTYPGGYCSKDPCNNQTTPCPTGSTCTTLGLIRGEHDPLCLANCNTSAPNCRTGYTCLPLSTGGTNGVCWLTNSPNVTTPSSQATKSGDACTTDADCRSPPNYPYEETAFCYPATLPSGASSGYTSGYCLADCAELGDALCGTNNVCLGISATEAYCFRRCPAPNGGPSTCRAGYVCEAATDPNGTVIGYCDASCSAAGHPGCPQGTTCQNGYCR